MLNEQQKLFAEEWVRSHNYSKALTVSGYKFLPQHSGTVGARLAKRCSRYIKYLEAYALREAHISIEAIQHEYVRVGFSNLLNYYVYDPVLQRRRVKRMDELSF